MSIADKLTLLINTKQDIKSAISEKGVEVTGGMTTYADAIRRIETGGGGDSFYVPVGLKFGYKSIYNSYHVPKFAIPKLILADGYADGSYMFDGNLDLKSINGIYTTNSSLINCRYMFQNCESLESIPYFDTSNVTDANYMFAYCSSLTTIPLLNTSKVTEMNRMFNGCNLLTTIPHFDTSSVTGMNSMFSECRSLTTIPQLDTSRVTNMGFMFAYCSSLTTIPQLNTSNVTHMDYMFKGCSSLESIPYFNTSNVTNMSHMFSGCNLLTTIPKLDTSSVTVMSNMFDGCSSLTTIPQLNTSNVKYMDYMFTDCFKLNSLPLLDASNVTDINNIFKPTASSNTQYYSELTDLGGFKNLKIDFRSGLYYLPNLTVQSLMNVINNLYDFVGNGSTTTKTLQLGATNLNKLTAEQKAVATNKGWVLA